MNKTITILLSTTLLGVMSLSAEMKCGAGKCGAAMATPKVKPVEMQKAKCCEEKKMQKPKCCESIPAAPKAPKKEAMKCGTGKCA